MHMSVHFLNKRSEGHFKSNGAPSLLLLCSDSFEDGAIVTRDAYIVFVKLATRPELQSHQIADIPESLLDFFSQNIVDANQMRAILTKV